MSIVPTDELTPEFRCAHQRLQAVIASDRDGEDPENPDSIQAMPIVLNIPKLNPPGRTALLEAAARAVVTLCLDTRAGTDSQFATALGNWYGARIRKIPRRARNAQWEKVQSLVGATVEHDGAQARAFLPSPVHLTAPAISKLQIGGTDLPTEPVRKPVAGQPTIAVSAGLGMSVGKMAAQVGHGSMLLAAHMSASEAFRWSRQGFDLKVCELSETDFAEFAARPDAVLVRDAGYTEVAPGSVTVVAHRNGF
ncbi:aminoacyl-tRNA hydrolase [Corynebacterium sp. H128]|uniref:aminoacyl-tRNA hydrolase n=1 Tax=Corynebacterium sp. H128 TaxID=3133427 RepID=UPI0030B66067